MWSDNETTKDFLNYEVHCDLLKEYLTHKELLPLTIGVFGDWGSGKSSIMRMLEEKFEDDKKVLTIYFNSWLFESYEDAKISLLENIILELSKGQTLTEEAKSKILQLLSRVDYMKLASDGVKKYGKNIVDIFTTGGALTAIEAGYSMLAKDLTASNLTPDVINKYIKEEQENTSKTTIKSFKDDFSELILLTEYDSVVIFIDDLDRCLPERVIDTLEAIKLFLSVDHTAFVIGADERILKHAISMHLQLHTFNNDSPFLDGTEQIVTDYIEKLIQIPYRIPKLSPSEIESYNNLLFCKNILPIAEFEKVYESYKSFKKDNFYTSFSSGHIKGIITLEDKVELNKLLNLSHTMSLMITNVLKGNPRQTKRFLNTFILRKKLANVAKLEVDEFVLVKLMLLEYAHMNLFEELNKSQVQGMGISQNIQLLENMYCNEEEEQEIESLQKWQKEKIITWIRTEPQIGDKDLRNYFWLSRDSTGSTMSDVHRTSPHIQKLYHELISEDEQLRKITISSIKKLNDDEQIEIFELLERDIKTNPSKSEACINVFYELIDNNTIAETFIQILSSINYVSIKDNVSLATKINNLYKKNPSIQENGKSLLEIFASKSGRLSTRAKQILEKE